MLDLPPPPTHCQLQQEFAQVIMHRVNNAQTGMIKLHYLTYNGDRDKKILKRALSNYVQDDPLDASEFGLMIYEECVTS
ncbi:hypothetical protein [Shewanella sp.]|uniref:hypothetical protein n=1 Tax=Shewanella sp. TaxID=50422 RepID=UPI00356420F7